MEKSAALEQMKKSCNAISLELMRLHPATTALGDKAASDQIIKALFELTKQVELIKKLVRKTEIQSSEPNADVPPEL